MEDNWELNHVSIVVRDIDKAVALYQSLGAVITKPVIEQVWDGSQTLLLEVYGKPLATPTNIVKMKACLLQLGLLTFELHEPVGGESPWKEFLDKRGEGVDHICFAVDDVEKERDKMVEQGFPVIFSAKRRDGTLEDVYYDTRQTGNVIISTIKKGTTW